MRAQAKVFGKKCIILNSIAELVGDFDRYRMALAKGARAKMRNAMSPRDFAEEVDRIEIRMAPLEGIMHDYGKASCRVVSATTISRWLGQIRARAP